MSFVVLAFAESLIWCITIFVPDPWFWVLVVLGAVTVFAEVSTLTTAALLKESKESDPLPLSPFGLNTVPEVWAEVRSKSVIVATQMLESMIENSHLFLMKFE